MSVLSVNKKGVINIKQEIKNGDFKPIVDWGSKDKTEFVPYTKTLMLYGRPEFWKRLFRRKSKILISGVEYTTVVIDNTTYLYKRGEK